MKLWRIATEDRTSSASDLTGSGAAAKPGRWNKAGQPVVYCAPSIAIAMLETATDVDKENVPLNRYLISIQVPDAVWACRETFDALLLPPCWDAIPPGLASVDAGAAWLASRRSLMLLVPSVIVPEEYCALINPAHPDAAQISAVAVRRIHYGSLKRH